MTPHNASPPQCGGPRQPPAASFKCVLLSSTRWRRAKGGQLCRPERQRYGQRSPGPELASHSACDGFWTSSRQLEHSPTSTLHQKPAFAEYVQLLHSRTRQPRGSVGDGKAARRQPSTVPGEGAKRQTKPKDAKRETNPVTARGWQARTRRSIASGRAWVCRGSSALGADPTRSQHGTGRRRTRHSPRRQCLRC